MTAQLIRGTTTFPVAIPTLDGTGIAETVEIEVPCKTNPETGEVFLTGEALAEIDRVKARHMGLLQPEQIKKLREDLGLTQKGISELLQIGAKSYTRWESGRERPSRSLNILLRALYDGKLETGYLTAIRNTRFDWFPFEMIRTPGATRQSYTVDLRGQAPSTREPVCRKDLQDAA